MPGNAVPGLWGYDAHKVSFSGCKAERVLRERERERELAVIVSRAKLEFEAKEITLRDNETFHPPPPPAALDFTEAYRTWIWKWGQSFVGNFSFSQVLCTKQMWNFFFEMRKGGIWWKQRGIIAKLTSMPFANFLKDIPLRWRREGREVHGLNIAYSMGFPSC